MENEKRPQSNPRLKATPMETDGSLSIGVSEKGAVSLYGLGRFPVTLYSGQMSRLLACKDEIELFMAEHEDILSSGRETSTNGASKDKVETYKVSPAELAIVASEVKRCTDAGDVQGAIKYATLKQVAELNGNKVGFDDLLAIKTLQSRK